MTDLQKSPWSGWETVRLIGRGSFGTVYELRRELVDGTTESAAMKVITIPQNQADISEMYGEGYDDESITATFRAHLKNIVAEYTLMRKLDGSANAVNCKDISYVQHPDGIGWDIFIRMELLTPLTKTLSGTVPEETVLKIGRDICSALVLCKKYDIVHRDIKPQNIFVSPNGDYKLGDFGIAKTVEKTMGGTKVGTYKYMAPEVYNNRPYGSGADLYSLGLVLYWLLNDRRMPFMPLPPAKILAGQDEEARQRRLSGEPLPPPAHGSAELKAIVLKACAYAPEERFHSAREMYEALCRCSRIPVPQEQAPAPAQPAPGDAQAPVAASPDAQISDEPTLCGTESEPVEPVMPPKDEKPSRQKKPAADRVRTAVIAAALILACCGIGIFGYLNCWFGHAWQAADCTTAKACTRCSAVAEEPLGHLWQEATCTTPKTCTRCGATEGKTLAHDWQAATCTEKMTCKNCGTTSGAALGHSWKAATCMAPKTCTRCGATEGEALGHSWEAATCTTPKTCTRCGATEGKSLGHSWKVATCTTPKTCTRCGTIEGEALGHNWKAAACTTKITCRNCGQTSAAVQIVSISAGQYHTLGIRGDGSVVACGMNMEGQCDVTGWTEIVAIAAGYRHTVGAKSDGTAIACGLNDNGQCNVDSWRDIVSVSAGTLHTVGLKKNGTAIAVGYNPEGACNVGNWNSLTAIAAGGFHTVGLRSDGTVVATGRNSDGQCNVSGWRDICAVAAGDFYTLGLKTDGTIVAAGDYNHYGGNATEWRNVIGLSVNGFNTIAIASDRSAYAEGFSFNYTGECNVDDWHNLIAVSSGDYHVVGLLDDGTVIATGRNDFGQCNVNEWK